MLERGESMSYPEYKEVVQFALNKLKLMKTFEILIYDTSTFIEVMNFHIQLMKLNPKTKEEVKLRNLEEYRSPHFQGLGQTDSFSLMERSKEKGQRDSLIRITKKLVKKGICTEKHLKSLKKLFSHDFLIIINRNIIDLYVRKESKFTCLVHEVLHIAQEETLIPQGLTKNEIDNLAKPIVKEFLSKGGQPFIEDMFIIPKERNE